MENKKKECKLVFNMGLSRALLRAGCTIVDLKASRENPDKTIAVFKNDELFQTEFERLNKEIAEAKAAQ
jgi:hypothetical protein